MVRFFVRTPALWISTDLHYVGSRERIRVKVRSIVRETDCGKQAAYSRR
jgi:hypothetical protein